MSFARTSPDDRGGGRHRASARSTRDGGAEPALSPIGSAATGTHGAGATLIRTPCAARGIAARVTTSQQSAVCSPTVSDGLLPRPSLVAAAQGSDAERPSASQ